MDAAPKAQQPKVRPKRRADEAQPKQRAAALQRAVAVERGSIHQAVQRERHGQGASSSSSTSHQGHPQEHQGAQPREPTNEEVDGVLRRVAENWLFTQPSRVQDGWHYMDVVELFGKRYPVVVRNHRTSRRRSFHPVQSIGRRFTVIHGGGRRSEVADNWSETWETTGWTGYTLFLQRLVDGPPQPADQSQSSTQPAAGTQLDEDVEEDGSFELVEDGAGSEHHPGDHGSGPRLRAMSLLSSATSATGLSVTSASTRLDADEGEMGLMDLPEVEQGQLEDSIPSGKGSGSASPEKSPKGKGYPKKGTMSPKTKK